jgi:hypothetical protein
VNRVPYILLEAGYFPDDGIGFQNYHNGQLSVRGVEFHGTAIGDCRRDSRERFVCARLRSAESPQPLVKGVDDGLVRGDLADRWG